VRIPEETKDPDMKVPTGIDPHDYYRYQNTLDGHEQSLGTTNPESITALQGLIRPLSDESASRHSSVEKGVKRVS
jgi:hypothetical protein